MNNKIKKTICLVIAFLSSHALTSAEIMESYTFNEEVLCHTIQNDYETAYPYFTLGTGPVVLIPSLGVGYRSRVRHHGFDISLNASSVIVAHAIQGQLLYHFYPDYKREDPWYIGAGVAAGYFFENGGHAGGAISPDIAIGKEFLSSKKTKQFIEAHIQAPTWYNFHRSKHQRLDFPLVYVKYGIAF